MGRAQHALILTNRGNEHAHPWAPTCECGWIGRFKRRQTDAEEEYRQHVEVQQRKIRRHRIEKGREKRQGPRRKGGGWRAPTPTADLPPELR